MVVGNLNIEGVSIVPAEANAVLIVDAYAVLPLAVAFQGLDLVAGNRCQIAQCDGPVQMDEFADRDLFDGLELLEWLGLGIWGRREEARKSWGNLLSNVLVYICDFRPPEFERNALGGVGWISKYQRGDVWFEYHGVLAGDRPTNFNAIIEVAPNPSCGFQIEFGQNFSPYGDSMLVDIAQFIKLPEGIIPEACPSVVRLKVFDDRNGFAGHVPNCFPESVLRVGGPVVVDREHHVPGRIRIPEKSQLPGDLVKTGTEGVGEVREAQHDIGGNRVKFTPANMASIHGIILLRECICFLPAKLNVQQIESLDMLVRPTYLRSEIVKPIRTYEL